MDIYYLVMFQRMYCDMSEQHFDAVSRPDPCSRPDHFILNTDKAMKPFQETRGSSDVVPTQLGRLFPLLHQPTVRFGLSCT